MDQSNLPDSASPATSPVAAPLDLTSIMGNGVSAPGSGVTTADVVPFNPAPEQEKTRGYIAYALLGTLLLIILFLVIVASILARDCYVGPTCAAAQSSLAIVTTVMNIVFTPVVGLVGSVIGFYFGAKSVSNN